MKKLYFLALFTVLAPLNAQVNLIPNGDFEAWTTGLPDSWYTTGLTVGGSGREDEIVWEDVG